MVTDCSIPHAITEATALLFIINLYYKTFSVQCGQPGTFSSQVILRSPAVTFPGQLLPRKSSLVTFPETNSPVRTLHTERLGKSGSVKAYIRSCTQPGERGHAARATAHAFLHCLLRCGTRISTFFRRETDQNRYTITLPCRFFISASIIL